MSDWSEARDTAVLAALATAVSDNDDDPVDEDAFIAEYFASSAGAGMGERLGYRVLTRSLMSSLAQAGTVTRTYDETDGRARYIAT